MKKYIVVLLVLVGIYNSLAQKNNTISGIINDKTTKQYIPNVLITISDLHRTIQSDSNGEFTFTNIPVGSYELQVTCVGYKSKSIFVYEKDGKKF